MYCNQHDLEFVKLLALTLKECYQLVKLFLKYLLKKLKFKLIRNRNKADKVRTTTNNQYHLMSYESASLKLQSLNEVRRSRSGKHQ